MTTFKDLNLAADIQNTLDELGFVQPTEIQGKAIPLLLSTDKIDFHGQAQTGTGKTLAFGLPLLQKIDRTRAVPQAVVVAPTRELAVQIYDSLNKIASRIGVKMAVIYGGVSIDEQISKLKRGVQIVIGTPGRINDLLNRRSLLVSGVNTLVLDEADIMLDMGFKEDIDEVLSYLPKERAIWLFSATVKSGIQAIKQNYMHEPVSVRVSQKQVGSEQTSQHYCIVTFKYRLHALTRFIQSAPEFYGFIFCQTKMLTAEVAEQLIKRGYNVGALHGDMSQAQRNSVIKKFRQKELTILVATDVAARGIDVADLTHVINYSIPDDLESYVHRIGRTGRAGKEGIAITFITKSEQRTIHQIERQFSVTIKPIDVPSVETLIKARLQEVSQYVAALETRKPGLYDNQLAELVAHLTPDQLRKTALFSLHDKFLTTLDLEDVPSSTPTAYMGSSDEQQMQEVSLSVGSDDGIDRDQVHEFIMKTGVVTEEHLKSIRVLKRKTFIKLTGDCTPALVNALRGTMLGDRPTRATVTCLVPEAGTGRFGGDNRGGDRGDSRRGSFDRRGGSSRSSSGGRGRSSGGYRGTR